MDRAETEPPGAVPDSASAGDDATGPEPESGMAFDAFDFAFDEFPAAAQSVAVDDSSAFVFDAGEEPSEAAKEEDLFTRFVALLSSPCFEDARSPVDLFRQDDATESVEAAFDILVKAE